MAADHGKVAAGAVAAAIGSAPHGPARLIDRHCLGRRLQHRGIGVGNVGRELSSLIRKAVKELTLHNKQSIKVEANTVADYLGVPKLRSLETLEDGDLRSRAADRRSSRPNVETTSEIQDTLRPDRILL
jgi:hypothetical protein